VFKPLAMLIRGKAVDRISGFSARLGTPWSVGAVLLLLTLSVPAFGDTVDPVGFCPPTATVPACTTGTGLSGETIAIGSTTFGMEKNGSGTGSSPWYLLVAIPNYIGAAPTITSTSFAAGPIVDAGKFLPTTTGSIYSFVTPSLVGDSSMNASNMFGSNEIAAFGGTPNYFEIFEYSFSPGIVSWTPYTFNVGGAGLAAGTFLAASGGSNPFSTPFTVTGLVNGPTVPAPEPGTLSLLGAGLIGLVFASRKLSRA